MIHRKLQLQRALQEKDEAEALRLRANPGVLIDPDSLNNVNNRRRFVAKDYLNDIYAPSGHVVDAYLKDNPALLTRNHYVLQQHHATAKHFDLRIQLRNRTVSFAIPKGLSDWQEGAVKKETRLSIMTQLHPIPYSLFEGGRIGTTGCWDIGNYKIIPTKASLDPKKHVDCNGDTTDEDEDPAEQEEDKFDRQLHRTLFEDMPGRDGQASTSFPLERRADNSIAHRGFIIELTGTRYKHLRLLFVRSSDDFTYGVPKGNTQKTKRARFMIRKQPSKAFSQVNLGDVSILSGRTMAEIKDVHQNSEYIGLGCDDHFDTGAFEERSSRDGSINVEDISMESESMAGMGFKRRKLNHN